MSDSSFFPPNSQTPPASDPKPPKTARGAHAHPAAPDPSESAGPRETSEPDASDEPQFGLVDVIEAFTAMRHEWRGQTRETRQLGEILQQTVAKLRELEDKLVAAADSGAPGSNPPGGREPHSGSETSPTETARRLAEALVEIDDHLARAVDAATHAAAAGDPCGPDCSGLDSLHQSVQQAYDELGAVARWLARPFLRGVQAAIDRWAAESTAEEDPTTEGLKLLGARVRRRMRDQQIERLETVGKPFDGETMNAVDAVARDDVPSGQVVEQIRPAYRWHDRLIQYADVRVAR